MSIESVVLVGIVFLLAGAIKGLIGFGLPTVSIAIIATFLGLIEAMTLMLLPSLVTNLLQGFVGGHLVQLIRRCWSIFILGAIFIWLTSSLLSMLNPVLFVIALGVVVVFYGLSGFFSVKFPSPGTNESWISPFIGVVSGGITGLTGVFVVPAIGYLEALRLDRDELIQAMGLWFTIATISLAFSLENHGLFSDKLGWLSALAVLPALVGMWIGRVFRSRLSEPAFRRLFFVGLMLLGVYISVSSIVTG